MVFMYVWCVFIYIYNWSCNSTKILNKRLTTWLEDNRLINETQVGFRKGYSTVDHVFTLLALTQKQLLTHGKLYAAFIDFKKVFDFVDRNRLWDVL